MPCGIYMIKNKVNGKMYIGQALDIEDRWGKHRSMLKSRYHTNKHLQNAWDKYGEESFEFSILLVCEENQLNTYEQYYIFELMTYDDRVGYNKNYGGDSGRPTEETRKKMSENHANVKGENNHMYGKHHTEETRKKMSKSLKGKKHPMYGRTGENNPKSKPIVQISLITNEVVKVWGNANEVARQGGFDHSAIAKCCRGERKTHKGYKWMYLEDYNKLNL